MMLQRLARQSSVAIASFLFWTSSASAAFIGQIPQIGPGTGDIQETILYVLNAALNFMGLVAVIVIVIAGIRLVVGGAEEQQREKAKHMIMYAVIGLIVIILASAIVNFVADTMLVG